MFFSLGFFPQRFFLSSFLSRQKNTIRQTCRTVDKTHEFFCGFFGKSYRCTHALKMDPSALQRNSKKTGRKTGNRGYENPLLSSVQLFYNHLSFSFTLRQSVCFVRCYALLNSPSFYDQIQNITDANVPAWRQHNIALHSGGGWWR